MTPSTEWNVRKCWEEDDNYQDSPLIPPPGTERWRGARETDGVRYLGSDGQDGEVLLGLQLAGGGVLGVPGQHTVDLTDLAGVETPLRQEGLQPLSHLEQ